MFAKCAQVCGVVCVVAIVLREVVRWCCAVGTCDVLVVAGSFVDLCIEVPHDDGGGLGCFAVFCGECVPVLLCVLCCVEVAGAYAMMILRGASVV